MNFMENLLRLSKASELLGVTEKTLRVWDAEGKIRAVRTAGNQRRIPESEVARLRGEMLQSAKQTKTLIYARCSTEKQRENMERQVARLEEYCRSEGKDYEVFCEIGSALNGNLKQLKRMIRRVAVGDVKEIVIEYSDRLTRFGFEYFVEYCKTYNVAIVTLEKTESKAFEQELAEDMLTLVTSYSARYYGRRGGRGRKAGEPIVKDVESEVISDTGAGEVIP